MSGFDELCAAMYRQDRAAVETLLNTGVDINLRDPDGRTLLMHAALAEDASPDMITFLLDRGADVNAADAAQRWTALHFAARDQKREVVRALLEGGAHPEPLDTFGNTPLWRAVMNRAPDPELIRLLLKSGANPARKNRSGVSPIDSARNLGHQDLLEIFERQARSAT